MSSPRLRRNVRKGLSAVQTTLVLAVVGVAALGGLQFLGQSTSQDLERTAKEVADPASLVNRWGNHKSGNEGSSGDDGTSGSGSGDYCDY